MIDYATYSQIQLLREQKKLNNAQITEELQLDPKTVAKWAGQPYQRRRLGHRPSKLEAFKGSIVAMLAQHPYSAQQILQRVQGQGYTGGYSILKEFVRQVRPVRKPAFLVLEFAPGECAQADWGSYGSIPVGATRRKLSFFTMVLCHSRMMYVEFTLGQSMEQFLTCHRHALEFFGSVPRKVMIDNLKTGVLSHPVGEGAHFHPRYLDFAAHYGFEPVACNPRQAQEKGRVENGVGYVKKNFLSGLDIPSFEALNPAARQWMDNVANIRLHGETRRKPQEMFLAEKPQLKPLSAQSYDCALIKSSSANRCCRLHFESNRYSVPHLYASQKLTLKVYPHELAIFYREKLIATHARSYDRHINIVHPDHDRELLVQRKKARSQTLQLAFLNLTPQAENYLRKLQEKRLNAPHHIQKIIALSEIYGPDKVARALQDALTYDAYGCEYIANILEQRERIGTPPGALHLTRRQDLLDLELSASDLSVYDLKEQSQQPQLL